MANQHTKKASAKAAPRKTQPKMTIDRLVELAHANGLKVEFNVTDLKRSEFDPAVAAASMDSAVKGVSNMLSAAEAPALTSEFAHEDKVFVRFGDVMVPGIVTKVGFSRSTVQYDVTPVVDGPAMLDIWSGFVLPRSDRHSAGYEHNASRDQCSAASEVRA